MNTQAEMNQALQGNPFAGIVQQASDIAIQSIQLQWGFILTAIGAILLIHAATKTCHRSLRRVK